MLLKCHIPQLISVHGSEALAKNLSLEVTVVGKQVNQQFKFCPTEHVSSWLFPTEVDKSFLFEISEENQLDLFES